MARLRGTRVTRADPDAFLVGDGWSYCLLSGYAMMPSREAAAEAWEGLRVAVWRMWLESALAVLGPVGHVLPDAARCFDNLRGLDDEYPAEWAAFRARRPDVAPEVDAIVSTYREHLRRFLRDDEAAGAQVLRLRGHQSNDNDKRSPPQ